jgi:hypothetical protein
MIRNVARSRQYSWREIRCTAAGSLAVLME